MSKPGPSQSSLLDLKALTAEHADRLAKEGKRYTKGAPRPPTTSSQVASKDPFNRPSPGLVKRLAQQARSDAKRRVFSDTDGVDEDTRRAIMEQKARRYEQLAKGDFSGMSEREMAEAAIDVSIDITLYTLLTSFSSLRPKPLGTGVIIRPMSTRVPPREGDGTTGTATHPTLIHSTTARLSSTSTSSAGRGRVRERRQERLSVRLAEVVLVTTRRGGTLAARIRRSCKLAKGWYGTKLTTAGNPSLFVRYSPSHNAR